MRPATNLLDYIFSLTFFPPLLAGPVVRAAELLPQIDASSGGHTRHGRGRSVFIICGLIKVIVADYISGNFVDRVFDNPALYTGLENLLRCIWASHYSCIAISRVIRIWLSDWPLLLGFSFTTISMPASPQSPTEWWRRWHISLVDMAARPSVVFLWEVAVARKSALCQPVESYDVARWSVARSIVDVYIIWGAWNGILLVVHKALRKAFPAPPGVRRDQWWRRVANIFLYIQSDGCRIHVLPCALNGACRADGRTDIHKFPCVGGSTAHRGIPAVMLLMLAGYLMHFAPRRWSDTLRDHYIALRPIWQAVILAIVLLVIIQVRSSRIVPFYISTVLGRLA